MASTISAGTTSGTALNFASDTTGILQLQTNGTTAAVTVDASQNVGIGTSSPNGPLDVNAAIPRVVMSISGTAKGQMNIAGSAMNFTANDATFPMTFNTGGGERMRIDSSGNLLVGTTSQGGSYNGRFVTSTGSGLNSWLAKDTQGNGAIASFVNSSNGLAGTITISGTTTTYGTSSDYRLKENVKPFVNALDSVSKLKPVTYTWKADGSDGQGFIAHELQEIFPDAVNGEKDAINEDGTIKPQNIDTSFLVATLVSAIQELNAKVDAQAAEIKALKGVA